MAVTLAGFRGIKRFIRYLASHPHKEIFYFSNSYDDSNIIIFTCSGGKVEEYRIQNCLEFHQDADCAIIINIIRPISGIIHTLLVFAVC